MLPRLPMYDSLSMQRHVSLIFGLVITIGLLAWLLAAIKNGTLDLRAAAEALKIR